MHWYALYVETGQEEVVQKGLRLHFDESSLYSVVPKRKVPEKKQGQMNPILKKMFPGYVLIRTRMNDRVFHTLKKIPKIYKLVNNGAYYSKGDGSYYSKIADEEMNMILKLLNRDEILEYSQIYAENSRVTVRCGPLKGLEGIIKKVDKRKNRAKILLNFMGSEKIMDVGVEVLERESFD